ncbi:hypothetical protein SBRCBS47491_007290 [Sporothrix bragantina]|uniref:Uncharacterized protein n=1 Tax=Sporothrix bragantina TaxID=671064 RepID=A0ABP0CC03_9PEZI
MANCDKCGQPEYGKPGMMKPRVKCPEPDCIRGRVRCDECGGDGGDGKKCYVCYGEGDINHYGCDAEGKVDGKKEECDGRKHWHK